MEKPMITYQKNADKILNRVIIPKAFIDKYGREFFMQVDLEDGKIILTPIKKQN